MTRLLLLCFSPSRTLLKNTSKTSLLIPLLKVLIEAIRPSLFEIWNFLSVLPYFSRDLDLDLDRSLSPTVGLPPGLPSSSKSFFFNSFIYFCSLSLMAFWSCSYFLKVLFSFPQSLVCESIQLIWLRLSILRFSLFFACEAFVICNVLFSSLSLLFSS